VVASTASARRGLGAGLPDFPWDTLATARATAVAYPGGVVDLSIGTPVDPTPAVAQRALAAGSDSPGYPLTSGTPALRDSLAGYLDRRWGAAVLPEATLPLVGSKELVAWLPTLLGLGAGDTVVYPRAAYPTYAAGVQVAGARGVACDDLTELDAQGISPALVWLNSPSNPTGQVLAPSVLAERVAWARAHGAIVASDECYGEFGWEAEPVSVLHPDVSGDSHDGLLGVFSLSKRSNPAGYRAGFLAGDPALVTELLEVRKHLGMLVPRPVQDVMVAVLADTEHVAVQRERYAGRRARLRPALEDAGFTIHHSEAGLYLWATRGEDSRSTLAWLAGRGILVAPGDFYGDAARQFVRLALTATDERIDAAVARLAHR
jgi:succinyldiaminopimelate transaminase